MSESGLVRPAEQETIATKEEVLTHSSCVEELHTIQGHIEKHLCCVRNRSEEKCRDQSFYYGFHGKEWIREGEQADPVWDCLA